MKTGQQYEESLRKLNLKVYLQGELVQNPVDHPIIRPTMNSVKMTYELAHDPQYENLMTATSHLTGKKINCFCNLHQSAEDYDFPPGQFGAKETIGQSHCAH